MAYALFEAGLPVVITNPNQGHTPLRQGPRPKLAKTDELDIQVLALYALRVRSLRDQEHLDLANLPRRQLQSTIVMEENCRRTCTPNARGNINLSLAHLHRLLEDLYRDIHDAIRRSPLWHEKAEILQSFTGVGPKVSASLIADMPELRRLPANKANTLAGLAPFKSSDRSNPFSAFRSAGPPCK